MVTSWREYQLLLKDYNREQLIWLQHTRLICYWSVATYLEKGTSIEKFFPLPLDGDPGKAEKDFEEKALALIMQREKEYLDNQKHLENINGL